MRHMLPRKEILFVFITCLLTTILILILMDLNSVNPDETVNLFIGKSILEGRYGQPGTYATDFMHRPPVIPSLVSLFLLSGIGINGARILIPILFMNLLIITTYIFTRVLYTKKEAFIAVLFLFTFPLFWRWGPSILTDVPLAVFSLLFLLFSYLGIERERKYLPVSALCLSLGLLAKISMIFFVVPVLLYILMRRKFSVLKTKEFWFSIILIPVFLSLVFLAFQAFTSATLSAGYQLAFPSLGWNISEILKLVLAPVLIFSIAGLIVFALKRRHQDWFVFLGGLIYLLFFLWTGTLRLRFFVSLIPFMAIFAAIGFLRLRERFNAKIISAIFIVLLSITFINTLYLIDLEEGTLWGAGELSGYINSLDGEITVASEYLPYYLKAATAKTIALIPYYIELDGKKLELEDFMAIVANTSHPKHSEYFMARELGNYRSYKSFDYPWLKDNGVDYLVISVYYDYEESGATAYYHPKFGPFEIPFIQRPYCNGRVPSDYEFSSGLYQELEASEKYTKAKEIYNTQGQKIFIIYSVK